MRREAAGLSVDEAARRASVSAATIGRAERDQEALPASFLDALRNAFPLDGEIYAQLLVGVPTPSLCSGCACSWFDPCADRLRRPCAWVDQSETICTACIDRIAPVGTLS